METLITEFMLFFGVSKPHAILKMIEWGFLAAAIPTIIFVSVRLGFHAIYFDVLKADMKEAKNDAKEAREFCWKILNHITDEKINPPSD